MTFFFASYRPVKMCPVLDILQLYKYLNEVVSNAAEKNYILILTMHLPILLNFLQPSTTW